MTTIDDATAASECVGRRERKKRETRLSIRRAALELALERGVDRLTVEEIAEAADVSPRTFFNYFSCKEDALVMDAAIGELRTLIRERPAGEPPLDTLRAAITSSGMLGAATMNREQVSSRHRLVSANPSLVPRQMAQYEAVEREMAEAVGERLGVDPDVDLRPALLAAVAAGAVRVALRRWTADGSRLLVEQIESAFDLLSSSELNAAGR